MENPNYTISPEQANSKYYKRTLQKEISIHGNTDEQSLSNSRINHYEILSYKAKILGNNKSFKEFADWTQFLISEYGYQKRCLSLGSGIGRVEKYLVKNGFTEKMETIELCANVIEPNRLKDDKITTVQGDLNFIELPKNTYDFILCHGILHHLINLEHILYQINNSLKPNGLFLVYEYVGETRWQFDKVKLEYLRKEFPKIPFKERPNYSVLGFESIRSGDLLELIQKQFGKTTERSVLYGGFYFPFLVCTSPKEDVYIKKVIEIDEKVSKNGILRPCYHMGLYRKNDIPEISAIKWSNNFLKSQLVPHTPLWYSTLNFLRKTPLWYILRIVKKLVMNLK